MPERLGRDSAILQRTLPVRPIERTRLQDQPPTIRACGGPGVRVAAGATSLVRQGRAAQIQVRQLAWVVDGLATPENWLVSHTTPMLVVAGLGSGVAPE